MAASAHWYAQAFRSMAHKEVNLESDTLKMALTTSAYAYDLQNHRYFSDVTNELPTGGGYTAGGKTLTSVTVTDTGGSWQITAATLIWSSATFTARIGVLYDSTPGSAATNPLLVAFDFGQDEIVSAGTFTLTPDATTGLAVATAS
jgi:hypothetical protein